MWEQDSPVWHQAVRSRCPKERDFTLSPGTSATNQVREDGTLAGHESDSGERETEFGTYRKAEHHV